MGRPRPGRRGGRSVALLSGGLDSVVATAAAARELGVALALTFDYGQRAAAMECAAAREAAKALRIPWKLVRLPWFAELLPPTMTRGAEPPPHVRGRDLDDPSRAEASAAAVWVPNRNGVFVNIAAAWAESVRSEAVVAGFNREEAASFPDNTREFAERATRALELSTRSGVRIVSPTIGLDKAEIVRLGVELGAPLRSVWSCYGEGPLMCGACESCARLVRALREARAPERFWPARLRVRPDGGRR